ncbi:glycoside hydrolase family 172 protein [Sphingobacterium hungaricum]
MLTQRSRIALFACLFLTNCSLVKAQVNFSSEIKKLSDVSLLPQYVSESVVKQESSYDRTGGNNDGFEGTYSYLSKDSKGNMILFEQRGKGVLERIWTPTPTDDTLDFYFDQEKIPRLSIRFRDLFTGKVYPFIQPIVGKKVGGFYSYLPLPYEKGLKIVFRGEKILFHQFQYRELPASQQVTTFTKSLSKDDDEALNKAVEVWNYGNHSVASLYAGRTEVVAKTQELRSNQSIALAEINEGGRILGIEIDSAHLFKGKLRDIALRITWDDDRTGAVFAPVAEFFGYSFGQVSMQSLLLGVNRQGKLYAYFPMPFDNKAKVELVHLAGVDFGKPISIRSKIIYSKEPRDKHKEGKFYAYWKREEPALGSYYDFLKVKGKGHYVGTILQAQATDFTNFTEFFEGDDSTSVDGLMTVHGTGSEDYFNGGWYAQPAGWVEPISGQIHGCLYYSLPQGRTGAYRFFLSDKMPFNKEFYHGIEHGPVNNNRPVDYSSLALYYAEKPLINSQELTASNAKFKDPENYSFYPRLMDYLTYTGDMSRDGFDGKHAEMTIDVNDVPEGNYSVFVRNEMPVPQDLKIEGYSNGEDLSMADKLGKDFIYIGEVQVDQNRTPINLKFDSPQSSKFKFDVLVLSRSAQ